jgi:DedD protein
VRDDVQVHIPSRDTPLVEPLPGTSRSGVIATPQAQAGSDAAPTPPAGAAAADPPGGAATRGETAADARGDPKSGDARAADAGDANANAADAKPAEPRSADVRPAAAKSADPKPAAAAEVKEGAKAPAGAKDPGKGAAKSGSYALQVGAFAGEKGASEQLERVRRAGLKGYTERIKTSQGERIRVRVGPFPTREAAEQARGTLKGLGMEPALITP